MTTYEEKKKRLLENLVELGKEDLMVAFSGGTDSSLLLKLCCEAAKKEGSKVYAITLHTELHPAEDLKIAARVALETGAVHEIIRADELSEAGIEDNPQDRCYRCKKYLFEMIKKRAAEMSVGAIVEGTNGDDLFQYRPGIRAIKELGILSPLAKAGLTKAEVRTLAAEYGISVADRPASPCMATRFPYGSHLTYERLRQVEEGEKVLKAYGFYNVRLRAHDRIARIEIDINEMEKFLKQRKEIISKIKSFGFDYVTMDLEGFRSGSMDLNLRLR